MGDFLNRTLDNMRAGPLGPLVRWIEEHPRLTAWFVLALGMVILLVYEARDIGLQPSQLAFMILATILVAGLCIWIISWEDDEETGANDSHKEQPQVAQAVATTETPAAAIAQPKKPVRSASRKPATGKGASSSRKSSR